MALKWGSNYPTHIKFNNNNVDEVKQDTTTVWTRPIFSFSDVYWLYDTKYFTITPGYNDSTHRNMYSGSVAFFKDTVYWDYSDPYMEIDCADHTVMNSPGHTVAWDQEFYYVDQLSGDFTINKSKMDAGTRSTTSSIPIGWQISKGTPPSFESQGIITAAPTYDAVTGFYSVPISLLAYAQENNAPFAWDCYLSVNLLMVAEGGTPFSHPMSYWLNDACVYNSSNPRTSVNFLLEDDSYYFIKGIGGADSQFHMTITNYTGGPNTKFKIKNLSVDGPIITSECQRPNMEFTVKATVDYYDTMNLIPISCVKSLSTRLVRGPISESLGLTDWSYPDSVEGFTPFNGVGVNGIATAHPLDTYEGTITLGTGWQLASGTYSAKSGQTYTINPFTIGRGLLANYTFRTEPCEYTLTINKGKGISSASVTVTSGAIGKYATGQSSRTVQNGGTLYYGDSITKQTITTSTGYIPVEAQADLSISITGDYTWTIGDATPYTRTLTVKAGATGTTYYGKRTITITRGTIGKAHATDVNTTTTISTVLTATAAYSTGVSYTLYNGDSYTVTFVPTNTSYWSQNLSGSVVLTSTSATTITKTYQSYSKPTITFNPTNLAVQYGLGSTYTVDVTPGVNAVILVPANNPTLYIKTTATLSLLDGNQSVIHDCDNTFTTQTVSSSTSAQSKSLSLYWANDTGNSAIQDTKFADWTYQIIITTSKLSFSSGQNVVVLDRYGTDSSVDYNSQLD